MSDQIAFAAADDEPGMVVNRPEWDGRPEEADVSASYWMINADTGELKLYEWQAGEEEEGWVVNGQIVSSFAFAVQFDLVARVLNPVEVKIREISAKAKGLELAATVCEDRANPEFGELQRGDQPARTDADRREAARCGATLRELATRQRSKIDRAS